MKRYAYLDGIRGVAALFVLLRHADALLGLGLYRGHLAVDIFFVMSGFVIAHAYDAKLRSGALNLPDFIRVRLIRLYPVYLLSALIAIPVAVMSAAAAGRLNASMLQELTLSAVFTLLFLPSSVSGNENLFPLNSVYWSLLFELLVNFGYAALRPRLRGGALYIIVLAAGTVTALVALRAGTMDYGFRFDAESVIGGLARATFGFAVGLILYRRRERLARLARGILTPALSMVMVVGVLCLPSVPGYDAIVDIACVFVLLPIIVVGASLDEPQSSFVERTMTTLGLASYPIYVLHAPVLRICSFVAKKLPVDPRLIGATAIVLLFVAAIQIDRRYDTPVRRYINERWRRNGALPRPIP